MKYGLSESYRKNKPVFSQTNNKSIDVGLILLTALRTFPRFMTDSVSTKIIRRKQTKAQSNQQSQLIFCSSITSWLWTDKMSIVVYLESPSIWMRRTSNTSTALCWVNGQIIGLQFISIFHWLSRRQRNEDDNSVFDFSQFKMTDKHNRIYRTSSANDNEKLGQDITIPSNKSPASIKFHSRSVVVVLSIRYLKILMSPWPT